MSAAAAGPVDPAVAEAAAHIFQEALTDTMGVYGTVVPVAAFITGLIVMQAVRFLSEPNNGTRQNRILVIAVTIVIFLQTVFEITGHTTQAVIFSYNPTSTQILAPWTSVLLCFGSCAVEILVQSHFARVVYRMVRFSRPLQIAWAILATCMITLCLVGGVASSIGFIVLVTGGGVTDSSGVFSGWLLVVYCMWLTGSAVFDTILSGALVSRFMKDIRSDGYNATNSFLVKLAVTTLEMFTLTAVTAIIAVVCAFLTRIAAPVNVTKLNLVCYAATVLVSRFYATSFIYSLERRQIRHKQSVAVHSSAQIGGFKRTNMHTTQHDSIDKGYDPTAGNAVPIELNQRRTNRGEGIVVLRDTVTHYETDADPGLEKERKHWQESHESHPAANV